MEGAGARGVGGGEGSSRKSRQTEGTAYASANETEHGEFIQGTWVGRHVVYSISHWRTRYGFWRYFRGIMRQSGS